MAKLLGIAGSLRRGSYNLALLRAAAEIAPPGSSLEVASIRGIPLYDADVESESGLPDSVRELRERVAACEGLILASPEYNNSIPGVFKNAIDWLSRPPSEAGRLFGGKPVALTGATPGGAGTRLAQAAWLPVLRALGTRPWFGKQLYVGGAAELFDETGRLTDAKMRQRLGDWLAGFVAFVESGS